jgi:hypothetical protein
VSPAKKAGSPGRLPAPDPSPEDAAVEVTVIANYQVGYDGAVYESGERLTVPVDLAEKWRTAGYVK